METDTDAHRSQWNRMIDLEAKLSDHSWDLEVYSKRIAEQEKLIDTLTKRIEALESKEVV